MTRQLVNPQPLPPTLFELFDDEPAEPGTPTNHRERVMAAMKSFIERNCKKENLTGRLGYGPPTTQARRIL